MVPLAGEGGERDGQARDQQRARHEGRVEEGEQRRRGEGEAEADGSLHAGRDCGEQGRHCEQQHAGSIVSLMHAERRLAELGLPLDALADNYALDTSGAKFVSHLAVGELLWLSGTVPERDGLPVPDRRSRRRSDPRAGLRGGPVRRAVGPDRAPPRPRRPRPDAAGGADDGLGQLGARLQRPAARHQRRDRSAGRGVWRSAASGTRAAIGCTGLGYGSSVEVFLVVRFDGGPLTEPMPTAGATGG